MCQVSCVDVVKEQVCASDGTTYSSECEMRSAACSARVKLSVLHVGVCEESSGSEGLYSVIFVHTPYKGGGVKTPQLGNDPPPVWCIFFFCFLVLDGCNFVCCASLHSLTFFYTLPNFKFLEITVPILCYYSYRLCLDCVT